MLLNMFSYSVLFLDVLCDDNKGSNQNIIDECDYNINDILFGCCLGLKNEFVVLDINLYFFIL